MPVYFYRCRKCGRVSDVEKPMLAPHPTRCECGGSLGRIFNVPAIHYKGSGFYSTDKALYTPVPGYDGPDEDELYE